MPVIRITDATWDRLKRWAVPLDDTPDDAVRKVLDVAEEHLRYPQTKNNDVTAPDLAIPVRSMPVFTTTGRSNRGSVIALLHPGVMARYLEGEKEVLVAITPTALSRLLKIRPARFVLTGHPWDGKTYGTEGYRTTVHAFEENGYAVDIGDGREDIKPYPKFDVRKK
jgi:hypothetical protein